jgi:hypothetical protein
MIEGRPGNMDAAARASCEETMEVNLSILDREDYPATEACQRGYEGGARSLIGGAGEPLIGHWHNTWDTALTGNSTASIG